MHLIRWAAEVNVQTGNAGEWFGPFLIFAMAALLDWSAVGPTAMRDRIAAAGYYASVLSVMVIFGLTKGIRDAPGGDWSWELTGSAVAFFMHVALILIAFGHLFKGTKKITAKIHGWVKFNSADSSDTKINTTLLTFAALAALSTPLARGAGAGLVYSIGTAIASMWSALGNIIIGFLGG